MADEKLKDDQVEEVTDDVEETKDGEDQSTQEEPGGDGGDNANKKQGKTFTQEQVNRMMTREKKQGRIAALKELGIDPKDTKAVALVKALVESQKTDEQKAAEKAAEDSAKQSESERRVLIAEAKAEAMVAGVQPQYVDDIIALVMSKMGDDGDGDMKSIIGEYKTKYPVWFEKPDDDKSGGKGNKKTGQKGTGSSVKSSAGDKDKEGNKGLGARLAAQRKSTAKSSYWGGNRH